jgi:uncharacterized protein (TIGR03435 family)
MLATTPRLGVMSTLLLVTAFPGALAFSQTEVVPGRSEFDVASVRPNASIGGEAYVQVVPGRLRMQNVAPRSMIQLAYGVEGYQISGGPPWISSDHFDIEAKAEGSPSTQQMEGPMLQALLEDRFQLAVRHETKQMPAYEFRLLNGSGKLHPSTVGSCVPYRADAPPPLAPEPGQPRPNFCDYPHFGRKGENRTLDGKGISIAGLAKALARAELRRPVIDRTDLPGTYDVHLEWSPDSATALANPEPADSLSIFTALREQLGLKLDSNRALSEMIVIDRIDRPSGN